VDTYQIYDGTDENGIVGTVAPGLFAQEGRCWRMVYANPVGHGTHCMTPVEWVGRWKFPKGLEQRCGHASGTLKSSWALGSSPLRRRNCEHPDGDQLAWPIDRDVEGARALLASFKLDRKEIPNGLRSFCELPEDKPISRLQWLRRSVLEVAQNATTSGSGSNCLRDNG
jgi:hypothetical protein